MADLQSRPLIELNLDTREITITKNIKYYDIDKNVANIFLQIYREDDSGFKIYLTKEELNSFVGKLFVIKPVTNDFLEITGINTVDFVSDNGGGVLRFIIPVEYTNRNGVVKCEIHVSRNKELLASDRFIYNIGQSLVTEFDDSLLEDKDFPILQQLIKDVQRVNNIDDSNVGKTTTYSSSKIKQENDDVRADILNKINNRFYQTLTSHRNQRPMVTFVDDDANPTFYSKILPLVKTYKIPFTSAVITSRVGTDTRSMTEAQLKEISDAGVELICHTYTHPQFNDLTDSEIANECKLSKKWLNDRGYEGDILAYAHGKPNANTRKIVRRYFDCALDVAKGTATGLLKPPLNTFNLQRTRFNEAGVDQDLNVLKGHVDNAISNNCWIVFIIHSHYSNFSASVLEDLIKYCKNSNIDIVTMREGLNSIGNLIDVGDMESGEYFIQDCNGEIHGHTSPIEKTPQDSESTITASSTPSSFKQDTITITRVNTTNAVAGGFPANTGGILKTYRMNNDIYTYQEYKLVKENSLYIRTWDSENSVWMDWVKVMTATNTIINTRLDITTGTIAANDKYQTDITISGINSSANVIATPIASLNGLILQAYSYQNNALRLVFTNVTSTEKSFTGKVNIYAVVTK